ncbi:MAG: hypothetical protein AAF572_00775 [Cyanobacteria bacterium P01_B01_bin.77]
MSFEKPSAVANAIMAGLYDILTNGDDTVPMSEDNFFSWCTPGIPIQAEDFDFLTQGLTGTVREAAVDAMTIDGEAPELTPELMDQLRASDTGRLYMQAESFARLVDFVPDMATGQNGQFARMSVMNNQGTLSERYEYILRMSQVMQSKLPRSTQKKIAKFRDLLTVTKTKKNLIDDSEVEVIEPSPLVQIYNEKMAAYEAATLEYNARRISALSASKPEDVHYWAMNANILRNRVKAAMSDWVSNGYKNDYEAISAFIDQVMRRDMALLKQQYRDDLEKAVISSSVSGSNFYFTSAIPGNFTRATGWTQFTFSSRDYNRYRNSNYNNSAYSGSTKSGFGLFGFNTKAQGSHAQQNYESNMSFDMSKFNLEFKIAQVMISRPWFKTAFLNSQSWRFDQNDPVAKSEMVSDGGSPPKGMIPAYPTAMIVIKDLKLSLGKSEGSSRFLSAHKQSRVSGGMSFAPLNLGSSFTAATSLGATSSELHSHAEEQGLNVPGMQVIGFKCHVLPKSPNPLPEIEKWI